MKVFVQFLAPTLVLLIALRASAADWKVGVARVKITPGKPLVLSGYASRLKPFNRVEHDLWAKALAFEDERGQRAVLVTTDLAGISAAIAADIFTRITRATGLPRERILLSWSHTHSGPRLSLSTAPHPGVPPGEVRHTVEYTKHLQGLIAQVATDAVGELQPAKLSWGTGVAEFAMNRREWTDRGIRLGFNPSGHVDRAVPVLRVASAAGRLLAILFQAATHNTTLGPDNFALAGDYSGFAQLALEAQHPGVTALYMTGCSGAANPHPRGTMELARQHGETLAREVGRVLAGKLAPLSGPLTTVLGDAQLTLQPPRAREELGRLAEKGANWERGNARTMLDALTRGEALPDRFAAPVAVWQFGGSLTLVALSGEVVSDYVPGTQRAIGHLNLWVAAYCHDYFGYLPSAQIVREGGYETRGLSSGLGWFAEAAEHDLLRAVTELARKAGRKIP